MKLTGNEGGFDFPGQNVRGYKGELLIKPTKRRVKEFPAKVRAIIGESMCIGRALDKAAQLGHPRLGQLSPPRGRQEDI